MQQYWKHVAWSLHACWLGTWPTEDPEGNPLRNQAAGKPLAGGLFFVLWVLQADLEFQHNFWGLPHWTNNLPCNRCGCTRDDFFELQWSLGVERLRQKDLECSMQGCKGVCPVRSGGGMGWNCPTRPYAYEVSGSRPIFLGISDICFGPSEANPQLVRAIGNILEGSSGDFAFPQHEGLHVGTKRPARRDRFSAAGSCLRFRSS